MPVLASLPQPDIKQFFLPSTASLPEADQAWVKMDVSPLNAQDFLVMEGGESAVKIGMRVFAERIKEWNFTEADGTTVPIAYENILRLDQGDLKYLSSQMPSMSANAQLNADQKKS